MNHRIRVYRSDKWLLEKRLQTGQNIIPQYIDVEFHPAELSVTARKILLEIGDGLYPAFLEQIGYHNSKFTNGLYVNPLSRIVVDNDSIDREQLDCAIKYTSAKVKEDDRKTKQKEEIARILRDLPDSAIDEALETMRRIARNAASHAAAFDTAHLAAFTATE